MDKTSIGIIGMGWVGSSVAISILHQGFCRELLLSDVRTEIAEGEAMDLTHGSSFYPGCKVRAASIEEMHHCKAIVITAGRGGKPGRREPPPTRRAKLKGRGLLLLSPRPFPTGR